MYSGALDKMIAPDNGGWGGGGGGGGGIPIIYRFFFLYLICCGTQYKCRAKALLMSTHNIYFVEN